MRIGGVLTTLGIVAILAAAPSNARAEDSSTDASPISKAAIVVPISAPPPAANAQTSSAPNSTLKEKVKTFVKNITPDRLKRDIEFKTAAETFPQFCQHWEQNLRDREANNLQKLIYTIKEGFETATYTGYGKIAVCESHQSKDGYSIGKITYEEFIYYLAGKTKDEARKAPPQTVSDTHTTEIFRFENNKWFY
jgi:uncharacterized protein YeaO (DUF488 family)